LQIASEKVPAGILAVAIICNRKTRQWLQYTAADSWMPKVIEWIKTLDPARRYQAVMKADGAVQGRTGAGAIAASPPGIAGLIHNFSGPLPQRG